MVIWRVCAHIFWCGGIYKNFSCSNAKQKRKKVHFMVLFIRIYDKFYESIIDCILVRDIWLNPCFYYHKIWYKQIDLFYRMHPFWCCSLGFFCRFIIQLFSQFCLRAHYSAHFQNFCIWFNSFWTIFWLSWHPVFFLTNAIKRIKQNFLSKNNFFLKNEPKYRKTEPKIKEKETKKQNAPINCLSV